MQLTDPIFFQTLEYFLEISIILLVFVYMGPMLPLNLGKGFSYKFECIPIKSHI